MHHYSEMGVLTKRFIHITYAELCQVLNADVLWLTESVSVPLHIMSSQ